jgi:hypothetical protein
MRRGSSRGTPEKVRQFESCILNNTTPNAKRTRSILHRNSVTPSTLARRKFLNGFSQSDLNPLFRMPRAVGLVCYECLITRHTILKSRSRNGSQLRPRNTVIPIPIFIIHDWNHRSRRRQIDEWVQCCRSRNRRRWCQSWWCIGHLIIDRRKHRHIC